MSSQSAAGAEAVTRSLLSSLHDPARLTYELCAVESVSGNETLLADAVHAVLEHISAGPGPTLRIDRDGDTIVARTDLGRDERIVVAGHLDTVPVEGNLPPRLTTLAEADITLPGQETTSGEATGGETANEDGAGADGAGADGAVAGTPIVWGRGACDMKAGVAMQLATAAALRNPVRDVTWVFYDHEEVAADLNGLGRVAAAHPDWLAGDLAILGEPSNAGIEGGCNGTIRVDVTTTGVRAHSARAFMGINAIHAAAEVLGRLDAYQEQTVEVDGLAYRESLSAVGITGGVAGNVVPDSCTVSVNYRFAPAKSPDQARAFLEDFFAPYPVTVTDVAAGARPGLDQPAAAAFVAVLGAEPVAKLGWTDVSRFSALGIPALNFGPGNPLFAHKSDEHVSCAEVRRATQYLSSYLEGGTAAD